MYRKFLTGLIVILSLVIVGMLGYLGYQQYRKITLNGDAEKFIEEFDAVFEEENNDENVEQPENNDEDSNSGGSYYSSGYYGYNTNAGWYKGHPVVGKIEIPATRIKYPILGDNNNASAIEVAVVKIYGPEINQPGNVIIAGHNYNNGLFFGNNKRLQIGDKIYITDMSGRQLEYTIYNKYYTPEHDNSYFSRQVANGLTEVTLYTCDATGANRLVIYARAE